MIDEQIEEQASAYVFGALDADEIAGFEAQLGTDADLRRLVDELREAAALLAHRAPARRLSPDLELRIFREIRRDKKITPIARRSTVETLRWIPWAIAACLAIACLVLATDRARLEKKLAEAAARDTNSKSQMAGLITDRYRATIEATQNDKRAAAAQSQIAQLNAERDSLGKKLAQAEDSESAALAEAKKLAAERDVEKEATATEPPDSLSRIQVATLTSKFENAPRATAVVVWDSEKQQGVLKTVNVPPNASDRDYQLWIVDPKYKQPVDAGTFSVETPGTTKIVFKPKQPIESANSFAVSLERKGGVAKAEGPMVLVGKL